MKKNPAFLLTFFVFSSFLLLSPQSVSSEGQMHPRNIIISKLHPRHAEFRFPHVPRVTAMEALKLYENTQAYMLDNGAGSQTLLGGAEYTEIEVCKMPSERLLREAMGRKIILYCG
jgi:hypothetical protein